MPSDESKVLFVEDNINFRRLITNQLLTNGYHVIVTGDIAEAEDSVENNEIDVILLDVMIEGDSGYKFLKKMNEEMDNPPPVIIVSAIKEDKFLDSVDEKPDYEGYVEKPCTADDIEAVMETVL